MPPKIEREELEEEVEFTVSETQKIEKKIKFEKGDIIDTLMEQIKELKKEVKELRRKNNNQQPTHEVLERIWDNDADSRWDDY